MRKPLDRTTLKASRMVVRLQKLRPRSVVLDARPALHGYLCALLETGLYGATLDDVVDRLVCEGIESQLRQGLIQPCQRRP